LSVRDGQPADVPTLKALHRRASWSNEGDRDLLRAHPEFLDWSDAPLLEGRTRVAVAGGRIVGFVSITVGPEGPELEDLFVEPDSMRKGIGRALILDAEASLAPDWDSLEVDANPHALGFYMRVGFVEIGLKDLEHGQAIRMRKTIRE
jgi:ribosomal protein S18 acetylase RimI-like enzyme